MRDKKALPGLLGGGETVAPNLLGAAPQPEAGMGAPSETPNAGFGMEGPIENPGFFGKLGNAAHQLNSHEGWRTATGRDEQNDQMAPQPMTPVNAGPTAPAAGQLDPRLVAYLRSNPSLLQQLQAQAAGATAPESAEAVPFSGGY